MELRDWTIEYVKAKNALQRTLIEHSISGDEVTFRHKHKTHHFLISPVLNIPDPRDFYTVVCLNTPENIAYLMKHWKGFLQTNLWVQFVNTATNQSWTINPKVHDMVADVSNLKQGVESMASEVPFL